MINDKEFFTKYYNPQPLLQHNRLVLKNSYFSKV